MVIAKPDNFIHSFNESAINSQHQVKPVPHATYTGATRTMQPTQQQTQSQFQQPVQSQQSRQQRIANLTKQLEQLKQGQSR